MESAIRLARKYDVDPQKAELAAYLHDYAKYWPVERQKQVIIEQRMPEQLLHYDKQLWHAPVGAYAVQKELGITDEQVLNAVRYHTSGRENMTTLEKVVCLADYIEPGRDFPGVDRIRALAEHSLNEALIAGFDTTIQFLIKKGKKIFPLTVKARNDLIRELKQQKSEGELM